MKTISLWLVLFLLITACQDVKNGSVIFVQKDEKSGYNFPYFLFIPDDVSRQDRAYLVVEPNNSGFADDDFQKHIDKARRLATKDYYTGNYVARALRYPLVVPVFPRSREKWKIYTHSLDRDVMLQKKSDLQRIDLQLLNMVEDARQKLGRRKIRTNSTFLLTGFSASGTFVNRFSLLHANRVFAAAAGGLNGLLMLPVARLEGQALNYPVGINDFNALFNKQFDKTAFKRTPQFWFMGEQDDNDAIPYDDAFDPAEREVIFGVLGEEMMPLRWQKCAKIYNQQQVNATIKTFAGVGHKHPQRIKDEIVNFFRQQVEFNTLSE
ncbi:MAG: hypothetical protein GF313_14045 [Caldithrix sp.]|nr:hypothetical protein [Caldithrix sp.]